MKPDEPAPRLRRTLRLKTLKQRRERWAAARSARRALFDRPTPVADRLLFVARFHKTVDYLYVAVCLLLGIRILAQLLGVRDLSAPFDLYTLLDLPLLSWFQQAVPPVLLAPDRQLDLPALIVLLVLSLTVRAVHTALHALTPRLLGRHLRATPENSGPSSHVEA